jgi:spore maturation protein CgeB
VNYLFIGLSITSSWGNGHATTYRGLIRELSRRGHTVTFLERDVSWYREHRDLPNPPFGRTILYESVEQLRARHAPLIRAADAVIVGSYVPDGIAVAEFVLQLARGVTAFYDIDTPVTLAGLEEGGISYLNRKLVPRFDLYLSFTGGPTLDRLEQAFGARRARALYCSVDPELYYPDPQPMGFSLGYLGTYSDDRQPVVEELLFRPARALSTRSFIIAGAQYPDGLRWPENVCHLSHVPPSQHRSFYCAQRFTLNVTRREMVRAGYSPSVRLFEAAACGTPIISDRWQGLSTFFADGEILTATNHAEVEAYLRDLSDRECQRIAAAARARVLREHSAAQRAAELDQHVLEVLGVGPGRPDALPAATSEAGADA